jgi:excisionase family DNA binding protein
MTTPLDALAVRLAPRLAEHLSGCVPSNESRWLTVEETAERTGLSRRTIYRAIQSGELQAEKPRGRWRIAASEADRWLTAPGPTGAKRPAKRTRSRRPANLRSLRDVLEGG